MEIIKGKEKNNKGKESVELVKDGKHLRMFLSDSNNLEVSFFYDDKDDFWFQESFEIEKGDEDVYKIVDGTFLSYGGDVFFDTYGANLILFNNEGSYKFMFMKEFDEASHEITCKFFNDSVENDSMLYMYNRLSGLKNTKGQPLEKPKTLSKTLNKIVEK